MNAARWADSSDAFDALAEREVHLWRLLAEGAASAANACWPLLSEDERVRAEAVRGELQQVRFVLVRGTLRRLLSLYEPARGREPFRYSPRGKPELPGSGVHFSVSHTGPCALFAFARMPVGVDIERLRPRPYADAVARRLFPPAVQRALEALPEAPRQEAFLRAWTQREAAVKALGLGVYDRSSELPCTLAAHPGIASCDAGATRWSLVEVAPWPRTIGTLAVPAALDRVRYRDAPAPR